jgi:hypothetical protein
MLLAKSASVTGFYLMDYAHLYRKHLARLMRAFLKGQLHIALDPTPFRCSNGSSCPLGLDALELRAIGAIVASYCCFIHVAPLGIPLGLATTYFLGVHVYVKACVRKRASYKNLLACARVHMGKKLGGEGYVEEGVGWPTMGLQPSLDSA